MILPYLVLYFRTRQVQVGVKVETGTRMEFGTDKLHVHLEALKILNVYLGSLKILDIKLHVHLGALIILDMKLHVHLGVLKRIKYSAPCTAYTLEHRT